MASITSVISFLILLLATYSYSAPVVPEFDITTPEYEFTTGTTIVERSVVDMQLMSDEESTSVLNIHKERTDDDSSSEEVTTSIGVTLSTRDVDEDSFSSTTPESDKKRSFDEDFSTTPELDKKRSFDEDFSTTPDSDKKRSVDEDFSTTPESSVDDSDRKRSFDEFSSSTFESSTEFDRRAIRPVDSQGEFETSTPFYSENQMESTTDFVPSSSVDSFAKSTGLLKNDEIEVETSTPEYQEHEQSIEESTTEFPVQKQVKQTISIIPGKITETKIYLNTPVKSSNVLTNVEREIRGVKKTDNHLPIHKTKGHHPIYQTKDHRPVSQTKTNNY